MSADGGASGEVDVSADLSPHGRSSSAHVTFSGPAIDQLDLTPPTDIDDASGAVHSPESASTAAYREVGEDAVWLLSSAKVGNGVDQLRDLDPNTFWQSDGVLPHALTIQFHKMTRVACVCLYLDQKLDESYTPSRISVRVGNGSASADVTPDGQPLQQGIREMDKFDLEDPQGWVIIHLTRKEDLGVESGPAAVRCHFVQIVVLNSFQNGRDTHIRQVRLFGPRQVAARRGLLADIDNFTSTEFRQFSTIR